MHPPQFCSCRVSGVPKLMALKVVCNGWCALLPEPVMPNHSHVLASMPLFFRPIAKEWQNQKHDQLLVNILYTNIINSILTNGITWYINSILTIIDKSSTNCTKITCRNCCALCWLICLARSRSWFGAPASPASHVCISWWQSSALEVAEHARRPKCGCPLCSSWSSGETS